MKNNKSFFVLFFQLIQTLISVFSLVLITRGLPVNIFGSYIYIVTLCSLLALFSGIGSEHVFLMNASRNITQIDILFGNSLLIRTIVNLFLIIFGFIFNNLTQNKYHEHLIFLSAYCIATYINPLFIAFYRVKGSHIKPWILSLVGPLFFLFYLLFFCEFQNLIEIAYVFLLSNILMFIIFCLDLRKTLKFIINIKVLKNNSKIGLVFMLSQVFDYIFLRVDILVVKFILGPYLLGIYAVGQRLVSFFQIIPSSFHVVELPVFHSLSTNLSELQIRFLKLRSTLIQIGVVLFGLLVLNSKWLIILFFSSKYKESELVVCILSFSGLINFACYPYYMLAEALNKINERLYIRLITLAFTLILLLIFCHFFNNEGASIAILIGSFLFLSLLHNLTKIGNGSLKLAISDIKTILYATLVLMIFMTINKLFQNNILTVIITNILFSITMVYLVFKFGDLKDFIKKLRIGKTNQ